MPAETPRALGRREAAAAIVVWALVIGGLVGVVGVDRFADAASAISPARLTLLLALRGLGVTFAGLALYLIIRRAGLELPVVTTVFVSTGLGLVHKLMPFGQATGIPVASWLLARWTAAPYERCFAALSMRALVGFVPAGIVFVGGGGYLVASGRPVPARIRPVVVAFALVVLAAAAIVVVGYWCHRAARRLLEEGLSTALRAGNRLSLISSTEDSELRARVGGFAASMRTLGTAPLTVTGAGGLLTAAFLTRGALLWLTLDAVGVSVSLVLALVVIQLSLLASGIPIPGGTGGIEGLQILLLVTVAGAPTAPTVTAVVISRGLVFWTTIVLGSLTLVGMRARTRTFGA